MCGRLLAIVALLVLYTYAVAYTDDAVAYAFALFSP